MRYLVGALVLVFLLGSVVLISLGIQIRTLSQQKEALAEEVARLDERWREVQEEYLYMLRLPEPVLYTLREAQEDFAVLVDKLRAEKWNVVALQPPRRQQETPEEELLTEETAQRKTFVGTITLRERTRFSEFLRLLERLQREPRLLRIAEIRTRRTGGLTEFTVVVEVLYAGR